MTFLAPLYLFAAALAALAVLALHFIVTREPRTLPLPTARFAPDLPAMARPRAVRPRDPLLMLLRIMLVLSVGAALAQPIVHPPRRPLTRIVLADRSPAVASAAEVADSVRALSASGDSVVPFEAPNLSAGLILGLRAASAMRAGSDSIELVLVSPIVRGELDQATDSIRALWPGAIRLVRVAAAPMPAADTGVQFDGAAGDPLRLALAGRLVSEAMTRLVRDELSAGDSAFARLEGRVLVHWPEASAGLREPIGGVGAGDAVVVAPFEHSALSVPDGARVVARWIDGAAAAFEQPVGQGCVRTVAVPVPARGDLVLTPRFARFAARLTGPCGTVLDLVPAGEQRLAALRGDAPGSLVAAAALPAPETVRSPFVRWLLMAALALALIEWLLRRRSPALRTAAS